MARSTLGRSSELGGASLSVKLVLTLVVRGLGSFGLVRVLGVLRLVDRGSVLDRRLDGLAGDGLVVGGGVGRVGGQSDAGRHDRDDEADDRHEPDALDPLHGTSIDRTAVGT